MNPTTAVTGPDHTENAAGRSAPTRRKLVTACIGGAIGGLALFCDLSLHAFNPLGRSYYLAATVMALCLLGLPAAYWLRGAIATGWRRGLAATGTGLVVLGVAAWITAFAIVFTDPDGAFSQRLTPAGSVLMALGMLLLGTAVLVSQRLSGICALAPLIVGVYFPAQLTIQLTFFINGKDATPGPNGALLGTWGLLWAWAAWAAWFRVGTRGNAH
ncbi:hypothetical protein ACVBEQ_23410 [Nakamurella sp. GG22]